jgi:RND family efflux transporter MFP subunit
MTQTLFLLNLTRAGQRRHAGPGVILLALAGLLLAACRSAGAAQPTPTAVPTSAAIQKPTFVVQRGTVTRTIRLAGRVAPVHQQELFFRSNGIVQQVSVARGDQVQAGQVLARLDEPESYQAAITAADLDLAQAQNDLEALERLAPVALAEAQVALVQAHAELEQAQQALQALDGGSRADPLVLEKARADAQVAENVFAEAQRVYNKLSHRPETDPRRRAALNSLLDARQRRDRTRALLNWYLSKPPPADRARLEADLALAQAHNGQAQERVARLANGPDPAERRIAAARVAAAEARLAAARQALEAIELRAPFAGQILSLGVAPGSQVAPFQAIATLADPSHLEIQAVPSGSELQEIGVGQPVSLQFSSRPGISLEGRVRQLPDSLSATADDSTPADPAVRIELADPAVTLTLGEAATVTIQVASQENVLWVPPAMLRSFQGQDFVLIQDGAVQRRLNLRLGLRSDARVEVIEGLQAGQMVVAP